MPDVVVEGLGLVVQGLEIVGAGALVLGFVISTWRFFLRSLRQGADAAAKPYRQALGRAVLIGLEILVAATIIKTITLEPSVKNMNLLAIMVVIRTMLGWSMVLEISDRWPWQRPRSDAHRSQAE